MSEDLEPTTDESNIVSFPVKLLRSSLSNFSVDNESGYEDGVSDVNEFNDHDLNTRKIKVTENFLTNQDIISIVEDTSALTIDTSNTRYVRKYL